MASSGPPPFDAEPEPGQPIAITATLVGAILVGVVAALFLLSFVFTRIPTDTQRLGVILGALHDREPPPEIAVFGNSVLMSGVDGAAVSASLAGHPVVWNVASTGQSFFESYLLTQELPSSVRVAVYPIMIRAGLRDEPIHSQKYNTLYMYGYRPEARTLTTARELYAAEIIEPLERSHLSQVFASRWALRQWVDRQLRAALRSDLQLDRATFDLFHPQSYEKPIDAKITDRFLDARIDSYASDGVSLAENTLALAERLVEHAAQQDRRTVFLFPPAHPRILERFGAPFTETLEAFREAIAARGEVLIVDALPILGSEHFIDDIHPTDAGAAILSRHLAASLGEVR